MPLPELESLRQRIDAHSRAASSWSARAVSPGSKRTAANRGLTPHYNLLDDRVQQAMLDVAREVVQRYGRHPSFDSLGGAALRPRLRRAARISNGASTTRRSPDSSSDTGVRLPANGPDRFALRQQLLTGNTPTPGELAGGASHALLSAAGRTGRVVRRQAPTGADDRRPAGDAEAAAQVAAQRRRQAAARSRDARHGHRLAGARQTPGIVVLPTRYVESMVPLVDRAVDLSINDGFAGGRASRRRPRCSIIGRSGTTSLVRRAEPVRRPCAVADAIGGPRRGDATAVRRGARRERPDARRRRRRDRAAGTGRCRPRNCDRCCKSLPIERRR